MGPLIPSGDVSSGFQSQSGQPYLRLAEAYVGPLIPSGDVSSGFQSQSGQPYLRLAEAYVLHVSKFYLPLGHLYQCP